MHGKPMSETPRCAWAIKTPLERAYHDQEWGVACHDERKLFEFLNLEGAQAGLSWSTILAKRETYRAAFDGWDPARIACYGEAERARLLADPGIVRNRLKVDAAICNAKAYLKLLDAGLTLDGWLWGEVGGRPVVNRWHSMNQVPATTALSEQISKALLKRGFKFVGSTIVYAYLQAMGMVNDHLIGCHRHPEFRSP